MKLTQTILCTLILTSSAMADYKWDHLGEEEKDRILDKQGSLSKVVHGKVESLVECRYIDNQSDCGEIVNSLKEPVKELIVLENVMGDKVGVDVDTSDIAILKEIDDKASHMRVQQIERERMPIFQKFIGAANEYVNCTEEENGDCDGIRNEAQSLVEDILAVEARMTDVREIDKIYTISTLFIKDKDFQGLEGETLIAKILDRRFSEIRGIPLGRDLFLKDGVITKDQNALVTKVADFFGKRSYNNPVYSGTSSEGDCYFSARSSGDRIFHFLFQTEEGKRENLMFDTEDTYNRLAEFKTGTNKDGSKYLQVSAVSPIIFKMAKLTKENLRVNFVKGAKDFSLREIESIDVSVERPFLNKKMTCNLK